MLSNPDLKKVTHEAFKILRKYDSVPPELYAQTFSDIARQFNLDLKDIDGVEESRILVGESITRLEKREAESKDSIQALKTSTRQANEAIDKKDKKLLERAQDDIENLSQKIARLEESMYKDELTSVHNRRWLFDTFLQLDSFKTNGTIGFVDLNEFKAINDTHGHVIGDKVLTLVAHLLTQLDKMGRQVHVCRFGGDEFLVLAPNSNPKVVQSELNAIKAKIESKVVSIKSASFKVSFSFGVLEFAEGQNFHTVLEKVDELMYQSKEQDKSDREKG